MAWPQADHRVNLTLSCAPKLLCPHVSLAWMACSSWGWLTAGGQIYLLCPLRDPQEEPKTPTGQTSLQCLTFLRPPRLRGGAEQVCAVRTGATPGPREAAGTSFLPESAPRACEPSSQEHLLPLLTYHLWPPLLCANNSPVPWGILTREE